MEQRGTKNSHSPFYDLSSDGQGKMPRQGELQIFSEGLKRKTSASSQPQVQSAARRDTAPRPKKRKSKRRHRIYENRSVTLTVVMLYAVVGFFIGTLMIARYSNIIKKDDELDRIEEQIETLSAQAEALRLEVSLQDDIGMVQKEAKARLGMYYPRNEQIVYVELDESAEEATDAEVIQSDSNTQ